MRVRDGVVATGWFDYSLYALDELTEIVSGTRWTLHSVGQDGVITVFAWTCAEGTHSLAASLLARQSGRSIRDTRIR